MLPDDSRTSSDWRHAHELPAARVDFRRALGCFATGVTVVTMVDHDGRRIGITANSFSSVSMDPPLILWSLARSSPNARAFADCRHFAINILAGDQDAICTRFAQPAADKFATVDITAGAHDVPLITGAAAHLECDVEAVHPGGDHLILVGRVQRFRWHDAAPLVFCKGVLRPFDTVLQEQEA